MAVLYDADCGLCRLTIMALLRLDARRRLDPVPLQWFAEATPTREALLATLHVRDAEGRWWLGGDAVTRIAAAVPLLVPLAILARLPGARRAIDAAYRVTAAKRGRLSRLLGLDRCGLRLAASTATPIARPVRASR